MIYIFEVILIFLTAFYLIVTFWLIYGIIKLRRQNKVTNTTQKSPKVSIVIAARNEEANIKKCLESCALQNYPQDKFEVIVVNDRSQDSTAMIVNNSSKDYKNIHLLNITDLPDDYKNSGKKHALKKGIKKAAGEILLLTDADCFPQKNWIKSMIQYFHEDVGVVIGHSPYRGKGLINRLIQLDNLSIIAVGAGGIGGGYPILSVGRNFAYRRKVYEEIGGFEKIKDFSSGDDDLLLMLVRKFTKWKINFASHPDSFVPTQPPITINDAVKQRMRWASKGLHYTIPMTLSLMFIFLYNVILLITIPLFFLNVITSFLPLISLIVKTAGDFIIIFQAARLLNESKLVKYFSLAALVHIPYLVFFGLYGTFGNVQWKSDQK